MTDGDDAEIPDQRLAVDTRRIGNRRPHQVVNSRGEHLGDNHISHRKVVDGVGDLVKNVDDFACAWGVEVVGGVRGNTDQQFSSELENLPRIPRASQHVAD